MHASILITCYRRARLLDWHLRTLAAQSLPEVDIVVLDDGNEDATEAVAQQHAAAGLPVRYLRTGRTDVSEWRVPGFALNIGIQEVQSTVVILSCAEIYHIGTTIVPLLDAIVDNEKHIGVPRRVYYDSGRLLTYIEGGGTITGPVADSTISCLCPDCGLVYLDPRLPYCMAIHREQMLDIGGYDEDFIGIGCDDDDLFGRLQLHGCSFISTPAEVVHLHHPAPSPAELRQNPRYQRNVALWRERKGTVVRNRDRQWGARSTECP